MRDNKVIIGLTGVVHPNMPGDDEGIYAGIIQAMEQLTGGLDFELISLPDLINTISVGRLNHHYPIAYGDLTGELNEFAAWKELTVLDPIAYKPYLQHPTAG